MKKHRKSINKDAISIKDDNEKHEYKLLKYKEERENYIKLLELSRCKKIIC